MKFLPTVANPVSKFGHQLNFRLDFFACLLEIKHPQCSKISEGATSLVPRLSWNTNIYPRLHNFNVRVQERGSLGTRLTEARKHLAVLVPRLSLCIGTRLRESNATWGRF